MDEWEEEELLENYLEEKKDEYYYINIDISWFTKLLFEKEEEKDMERSRRGIRSGLRQAREFVSNSSQVIVCTLSRKEIVR